VLSALARFGSSSPAETDRAFLEGVKALGWSSPDLRLTDEENATVEAIDSALNQLDSGPPSLKKQILEACATCVGADGQVTIEEAELLRAISDSLGCPLPPLLSRGGMASANAVT
jgi:hypothetical protein